MTIQFENLGLTLRDGTTVLSGVTGTFSHTKVAAIMGPSGAGKSTLLNVLMGKAGRLGKTSGSIRVNGRAMRLPQLRVITGFVPQDDIVHEDLTVHENLVRGGWGLGGLKGPGSRAPAAKVLHALERQIT